MQAHMRDITRQMSQLQSAMDSVKRQARTQQHPFDPSYPPQISSLPHLSGATRASPQIDNQMSWKSVDVEHHQLVDHSKPGPTTAQSMQQPEISSTTARTLQPSVQVTASLLDLNEPASHSAILTGPESESPQSSVMQSALHTPSHLPVKPGDLKPFEEFSSAVNTLVAMLSRMNGLALSELQCGKLPGNYRHSFAEYCIKRGITRSGSYQTYTLPDQAKWLDMKVQVLQVFRRAAESNPAEFNRTTQGKIKPLNPSGSTQRRSTSVVSL